MIGQHRAVSAAVGAHDQVVLFVVAAPVGLIEAAELVDDPQVDEEAEADHGRDVVISGQVFR